ncbi:hypothetical protein MHB56_10075 [Paenibacillus sp. FSL H8-0315]
MDIQLKAGLSVVKSTNEPAFGYFTNRWMLNIYKHIVPRTPLNVPPYHSIKYSSPDVGKNGRPK